MVAAERLQPPGWLRRLSSCRFHHDWLVRMMLANCRKIRSEIGCFRAMREHRQVPTGSAQVVDFRPREDASAHPYRVERTVDARSKVIKAGASKNEVELWIVANATQPAARSRAGAPG